MFTSLQKEQFKAFSFQETTARIIAGLSNLHSYEKHIAIKKEVIIGVQTNKAFKKCNIHKNGQEKSDGYESNNSESKCELKINSFKIPGILSPKNRHILQLNELK